MHSTDAEWRLRLYRQKTSWKIIHEKILQTKTINNRKYNPLKQPVRLCLVVVHVISATYNMRRTWWKSTILAVFHRFPEKKKRKGLTVGQHSGWGVSFFNIWISGEFENTILKFNRYLWPSPMKTTLKM